jgi:hypothetical protein
MGWNGENGWERRVRGSWVQERKGARGRDGVMVVGWVSFFSLLNFI